MLEIAEAFIYTIRVVDLETVSSSTKASQIYPVPMQDKITKQNRISRCSTNQLLQNKKVGCLQIN